MFYTLPRKAFSLVELSIVLVILGLLVGGILAGRSLVRAAELRSVTTEYQRWIVASQAFRDKYFGLPGDITNATTIWGRQSNSTGGCPSTSGATINANGACDGNGNGQIDYNLAYLTTGGEMHQFWRQLALAGLIEGNYTGNPGGVDGRRVLIGLNAPTSRFSSAGWGAIWLGERSGDATFFNGAYGNTLHFGKETATQTPRDQVLRVEEAWNIDTKIDDASPAQGKLVVIVYNDSCAINSNGTPAVSTSVGAVYNVSNAEITCALVFRNVF